MITSLAIRLMLQYCTPPTSKGAHYAPNSTCDHVAGKGAGIAWSKNIASKLKSLHKKGRLRTAHGGSVPLYLTEFGYFRTEENAIPEAYRAKWLPEAMDVALKSGAKSMNVYQVRSRLFYAVVYSNGSTVLPRTSGAMGYRVLIETVESPRSNFPRILNADGSPTPTYLSLQNWARKRGYIH